MIVKLQHFPLSIKYLPKKHLISTSISIFPYKNDSYIPLRNYKNCLINLLHWSNYVVTSDS